MRFYYAKNRPCTPEETTYIKSLGETIQNFDFSKQHEGAWTIAEMAVRIPRIRLENLENLKIWEDIENDKGEISKAFEKAYSWSKLERERMNKPEKHLLMHYFHFVLGMNIPTKDLLMQIPPLLELLVISYHI
ncbi:hypothetical protein Egran_04355, partial [Elaphomyces granulatus]